MSEKPEQTSEEPREQGISLQGLSEAFRQAVGGRAESQKRPEEPPAAEGAEAGVIDNTVDLSPEPQNQEDDDPCRISPQTILEAMLFVDNQESKPLDIRRAAELMRGVEPEEIAALVDRLNQRYAAAGCPYEIGSEGAGFRLVLRKEFRRLRNRFYGRVRQARLSQAAINVLAIVAYKQPLTAEQVFRLRGKPSGHLLAQLVRRRLLEVERPDKKPRKSHYRTTDRFLKLFGLESLDDLPQSEELEM